MLCMSGLGKQCDLAAASLRTTPLNLLNYWFTDAKHLPQPRLQHYVCRAFAASVHPILKVLNFDNMSNLGMTAQRSATSTGFFSEQTKGIISRGQFGQTSLDFAHWDG